jgi:ADP-ribose pyrophosphatase YjhB (NUDIX family)
MTKIRATAVVRKDDKILMIHRLRQGWEHYTLPGGKVEKGETVKVAVLRELMEETSIVAKLGERLISFADKEGREHQLFQCEYISGETKLSDDSVELLATDENNKYEPMWVEISQLENLIIWPEGTKEFLKRNFGAVLERFQ